MKNSQKQRESISLVSWLFLIPLLCLGVLIALNFSRSYKADQWVIIGAIISYIFSLIAIVIALSRIRKGLSGRKILIVYFLFLSIGQGIVIYDILVPTHKFPAFTENAKNVNIAEYMASKNNTTEEKVKTSILYAWGDRNPEIKNIKNGKSIADFKLSDGQIFLLKDYLNIAIISASESVQRLHPADVKAADTIQDMIDLVEKAIKSK